MWIDYSCIQPWSRACTPACPAARQRLRECTRPAAVVFARWLGRVPGSGLPVERFHASTSWLADPGCPRFTGSRPSSPVSASSPRARLGRPKRGLDIPVRPGSVVSFRGQLRLTARLRPFCAHVRAGWSVAALLALMLSSSPAASPSDS